MDQDILTRSQDNQEKEEQARRKRTNILVPATAGLILLAIAEWIAFHHGLQSEACYFQDNLFLRSLWPPNLVAFNQVQSLPYSNADKCVFYAMRSSMSITVFSSYFVLCLIQIRFGRRIIVPTGFGLAKFALLIFGFSVFYMTFDDFSNYSGPKAFVGFHPSDSMGAVVIKSAVRIFIWNVLFFLLGLLLWSRFQDSHEEN